MGRPRVHQRGSSTREMFRPTVALALTLSRPEPEAGNDIQLNGCMMMMTHEWQRSDEMRDGRREWEAGETGERGGETRISERTT